MSGPKIEEKRMVEVEVNPHETTLAELLEMAEEHNAGTISVRGEMADGTVQWGVVVTCGDRSGQLMENLQSTVDDTIAKWLVAKMN